MHVDDYLSGRNISHLECGHTQTEVSEELEIAQSVISRSRQRSAFDLLHQLSAALDKTVSRQTVYRRVGHIGHYAHRPVRCVPLTVGQQLARIREHEVWISSQQACGMFSEEFKFSLQPDSC
ncbi:HTH_Tnp_Tc3_2 domain-containing protein [Trichonephila clavipes]|nr:HTH_Tnp_Tc3_2 domain-containing protein [Trichonephila clavipes]